MCSIFSVITNSTFSDNFKLKAPEILKYSINRGPDQSNHLFFKNKIFLGSNRLKIIDESDKWNMPLKSLMGDYRICFNGEIYNYKELRQFLKNKGYKFNSNTDTEVVLNLYIYYWEKFVSQLNGIFAFVIYDKNKNIIVSARDRFGSKPLYYFHSRKFIAFCSDFLSLKTLIPKKELCIEKKTLSTNIFCRFIPGNKTIFKNIYKLVPAEILTINIKDFKINKKIYWTPLINLKEFSQDEFNINLSNALIKTSIADVNPVILLSGWLDSSSLVSVLHNENLFKIKTYSCSFSKCTLSNKVIDWTKITNGSPDESDKAFEIANKFKTKHTHYIIDSSINLDMFKDMQRSLSEPISITNALWLYLFGRKLKWKIRLALSGTWSDELLWWYEELYFNNILDNRKSISNMELLNSFCDFDNWWKNPLDFLRKDLQDLSYLESYTKKSMQNFSEDNEYLNQLTIFELSFALPNWELDMADRLFMDSSIELRPSFLENDFLDYCLTIPTINKKQKAPLREAMKGNLPLNIINQRKIPSLSTPIDFLYSKCFQELIQDLKDNPLDIWNKEELFNYISKPYEDLSFDILYRIVYLQSWLKEYYYKDYEYIKVTINN